MREIFCLFLCLRGKKMVCFWLGAKRSLYMGKNHPTPTYASDRPLSADRRMEALPHVHDNKQRMCDVQQKTLTYRPLLLGR